MQKNVHSTLRIDWKPTKNTNQPLPSQIIDYFLDKISKGEWLVGDRLPSQRELATAFDVNRSTIVEALSELIAMGILNTNHGQGTRIANNTWSLLASISPPNWGTYISSGMHVGNLPTIQTINTYEYIPGIIKISTGELGKELAPVDVISRALVQVAKQHIHLSYLEPLGLLPLREALAAWYTSKGFTVDPANILIVSGSLQALHLISIGILPPNTTVFVEKYSYIKTLRVLHFAKTNITEISMDEQGLIPSLIDAKLSRGQSGMLYTIPTFHNPTGITMSQKRRVELLDWCKLHQLPIIEDSAYNDLWFEKQPPAPIKSIDDSGMVLFLGSLSKSFSPGFRLGWLIGPKPVVSHLGDIKMQVDYGANSIAQWAFADLLRSGAYEKHLVTLRQLLLIRRNHMLSLLETFFYDLATWNRPQGGYYIWVKLKKPIPASKVFHLAIEKNILINPGGIYSDSDNQYIRLSYSYCTLPEMEFAIEVLSNTIRSLMF